MHGLAGRYDNPMSELTLSPSHGSMNSNAEVYTHGPLLALAAAEKVLAWPS